MENDGRIPPIESIGKTLRVKPIGAIRLFKRPEYMPQKRKHNHSQDKREESESERRRQEQDPGKIVNHASHAGKIGVSVDYKV